MCYFQFGFLLSFMDFLWFFEFCGKTSVLTMSSQDKIKRKSTEEKFSLWPFYGGLRKTICKMAALFLQFRIQFILQKACVTREWDKFFYFYAIFPLD